MRAVTVPWFLQAKRNKEPIVMLSLYEAWSAKLASRAGVRVLLVGDSLGYTIRGEANTLSVTLDEVLYHTRAVRAGAPEAFVVADMPFLSVGASERDSVLNAGRLIQEGGAQAVKIEGGAEMAPAIAKMTALGIPVMGHLGFTPQQIYRMGGHKVQGKTPDDRRRLMNDARALEQAGAFSIVLELVTEEAARDVTGCIQVPTIGIGAGAGVDGQVLVFHDLVGLNRDFKPRYLKRYAELGDESVRAVQAFMKDIQAGSFPGADQAFHVQTQGDS